MRVSSKTKRASAIMLAIACFVVLQASCAGHSRPFRIELISASMETEFWTCIRSGAHAAAKLYNAEIKTFGPGLEKGDSRQENLLRQSIARSPDAIILSGIDSVEVTGLVNLALNSGIKVVSVESRVNTEDNRVLFAGSDNYMLGKSMAQEIKAALASGMVAVVGQKGGPLSAKEREKGFLEEMAVDSLEYQILEPLYFDFEALYLGIGPEAPAVRILDLLNKNGNPDAVVCLDAQATTSIGRAIDETDYTPVFLAGVDCSVEQAGLIEQGILDMTLLQDPYSMGFFGVELATKQLSGRMADISIHTDVRIITRENMFSEENLGLVFPIL